MRRTLSFLAGTSLAVAFLSACGGGTPAPASSATAAEEPSARSIVNVTGDLYRAQNNNHFTVFLVTPQGIILSDPINRSFATWLRGELQQRFGAPVRYVLYTHHHWDHASGGQVFADTAQFVAHENMRGALALPGWDPPFPEEVRNMDANGNGRIERGEAGGVFEERFALYDANGDGALSGAEVARGALGEVHPPTITYTDRHTVTLGGKRVDLVHTGNAHAPDMAVLHFPDERVVFGADLLQVKRLPGNIAPTPGAWIEALSTVAGLDFDVVVPGHGDMGTKADITALLQYVKDLAAGVGAGVAAGRSVSEIQASLSLAAYREWDRYDTNRNQHIAQVYRTLAGSP